MNWYKKAQQEVPNQYQLSQMIEELKTLYMEYLGKEWKGNLLPAEKEKMDYIGNRLDYLGRLRKEDIESKREETQQLIGQGREHEVSPRGFIDYHHTGSIPEEAYKQYETMEGMSWLGTPEKYPILAKKDRYGDEIIEFRKRDEKLAYTQKDPNDPTGFEFLKDKEGNLIHLTDEQIKEKGLPLYDTLIVAFNEKGEPIGHVSNEFGADGVWVVKEYQGRGIGTDLLYEFRKQFKPKRQIGQMTGSGQRMTRSYHKKLVEQALREGKEIPKETLQEYELL